METLPDEILLLIFSYCQRENFYLSYVCKSWNRLFPFIPREERIYYCYRLGKVTNLDVLLEIYKAKKISRGEMCEASGGKYCGYICSLMY